VVRRAPSISARHSCVSGTSGSACLRQIGKRDYTDEPLGAIYDRQPANLDFGHVLSDLVDVLVVKTIFHLFRHHVPDFGIGSLAFRNAANRDPTAISFGLHDFIDFHYILPRYIPECNLNWGCKSNSRVKRSWTI
jgi:hypothetical protein